MRRIGIIGYGALGKQILGLLFASGRPDSIVFFDDPLYREQKENAFPFEAFNESRFADHDFYLGLGYRHLSRKAQIVKSLLSGSRRVPSFVHPSCQVHASCRMGEGCLIYPMCNLDQEVELGHGVLLNNSAVVSHNSRVGDASYLSPGVVLSGGVTVGEAAFLGTGTVVSNARRIGSGARVGIGSVVTVDVPDGGSAIGNPIRLLSGTLNLD